MKEIFATIQTRNTEAYNGKVYTWFSFHNVEFDDTFQIGCNQKHVDNMSDYESYKQTQASYEKMEWLVEFNSKELQG